MLRLNYGKFKGHYLEDLFESAAKREQVLNQDVLQWLEWTKNTGKNRFGLTHQIHTVAAEFSTQRGAIVSGRYRRLVVPPPIPAAPQSPEFHSAGSDEDSDDDLRLIGRALAKIALSVEKKKRK